MYIFLSNFNFYLQEPRYRNISDIIVCVSNVDQGDLINPERRLLWIVGNLSTIYLISQS